MCVRVGGSGVGVCEWVGVVWVGVDVGTGFCGGRGVDVCVWVRGGGRGHWDDVWSDVTGC